VERKDLKPRFTGIACLVLQFFIGNTVFAAEPQTPNTDSRYLGFISFVRSHPCVASRYRQLAASFPWQGTSDGGEGHPWCAMYGFCVAQKGRFSIHQDWIVSYLDVEPDGDEPGCVGVKLLEVHSWATEAGGDRKWILIDPKRATVVHWERTDKLDFEFL